MGSLSLAASLVGLTFIGTFFWPASPEAAAVYYVTVRGWFPLTVAVLAALGQAAAAAALFGLGGELRRRWRWFDGRCESARAKVGKYLAKGQWVLAGGSGLLGVPPMSVTAALAPGLGVSPWRFFPLVFVGRVVRFVLVTTVILQLRHAWRGH